MNKIRFIFIIFTFFFVFSCNKYKITKYFNLSEHFAHYVDVALDNNGNIYVAFKDFAHKHRFSVKKIDGDLVEYVGKPAFSDMDCLYNKIITVNDIPFVAYSDYSMINRLTVNRFINNQWEVVGTKGISDYIAENIDIACDKNSNIYVVYSEKNSLFFKVFKENKWNIVYQYTCSNGTFETLTSSIKLVIDSNNNPIIFYPDPDNNFYPTLILNILTNPQKIVLSNKISKKPAITIDKNDNIYILICEEENDTQKTMIYKIYNDKITAKYNFNGYSTDYAICMTKDNRLIIAYQNSIKNNTLSVTSFYDGKFSLIKDNLSKDFVRSIDCDAKNNQIVIAFQDNAANDKAGVILLDENL